MLPKINTSTHFQILLIFSGRVFLVLCSLLSSLNSSKMYKVSIKYIPQKVEIENTLKNAKIEQLAQVMAINSSFHKQCSSLSVVFFKICLKYANCFSLCLN